MVDYRRAVLGLFFEQESPVPPLTLPVPLLAFWHFRGKTIEMRRWRRRRRRGENNKNEEEEEEEEQGKQK